jgi:hypothetical protein
MSQLSPVELQFQLHPGAEAPERSVQFPRRPGRLPRVTQMLALAIHFENILNRGDAEDYAHLGRLTGLCRERISQIMRLNYLAPDIQVEVLYLPPTSTGRYPISEVALRKVANLLSWAEQRAAWARLRHYCCLR